MGFGFGPVLDWNQNDFFCFIFQNWLIIKLGYWYVTLILDIGKENFLERVVTKEENVHTLEWILPRRKFA